LAGVGHAATSLVAVVCEHLERPVCEREAHRIAAVAWWAVVSGWEWAVVVGRDWHHGG